MKIISWNIQQGGGRRISKILEAIQAHDADIVVLSEFRNNKSGQSIINVLSKALYPFHYIVDASLNKNSVCIFSKIQAEQSPLLLPDPEWTESIVKIEFEAFILLGVYLPHKKKHKLFNSIHHEIENSDALIVCGDFNSGFNGLDQKGNSFWYSEDLLKMLEMDCADAFRFCHLEAREYSWYSHAGNGFRYDHTWLSIQLAAQITGCYYDHSVREEKISDHSLMVLDIEV